jgi:hypothetical protein
MVFPLEDARYADVCGHMRTYSDVCWRMLTYSDVCWHMLTYADVCGRMRTYADVCGRMRTYADVDVLPEGRKRGSPFVHKKDLSPSSISSLPHMSAYVRIRPHTSAYVRGCRSLAQNTSIRPLFVILYSICIKAAFVLLCFCTSKASIYVGILPGERGGGSDVLWRMRTYADVLWRMLT